ncbi:MAG: cell division protein CrgA [Actinobacteria bacterium]|nr:cell division protein CrgA [Actinomycetota bacterium]
MPESKGRKKDVYTPPPTGKGERKVARLGSPRWLAPTMVALFVIGLTYIVIFYIAGSQIPVMKDLSPLVNVGIGFVFIAGGFGLATRWR